MSGNELSEYSPSAANVILQGSESHEHEGAIYPYWNMSNGSESYLVNRRF
jgi:hypothetical protein